MAAGDPRLTDLGKLALILSPGLAGLILNRGLGDRGLRPRWAWAPGAAGVTLAVAFGALVAAWLGGAASFSPLEASPGRILPAVGASALTSVLEELGWSGGGLALAIRAFGRRWGVLILGLVWAAWHLIAVGFHIGLFPDLEAGPPAMILAFIAACLVYRELLATLRLNARTWIAGAIGHAAPNMLIAGLMAAGLGGFHRSEAWPLFPAPGGLVFLGLALAAVLALHRFSRGDAEENISGAP